MADTDTPQPKTPSLTLSQEYEYEGKKYGPGDAVEIAEPGAFTAIRRAEIAYQRGSDLLMAQESDKSDSSTEKAPVTDPNTSQPLPKTLVQSGATADKE